MNEISVYAGMQYTYLLVFQIWMVSSSTLLCFSACSSRKSKKYLTAGGTTAPEHSTLRKKSSTNCCSVPWKGPQIMWDSAEMESRDRNIKPLRHSYLHVFASESIQIFKVFLPKPRSINQSWISTHTCVWKSKKWEDNSASVPWQKGAVLNRSL